jgi:hypothetical protein
MLAAGFRQSGLRGLELFFDSLGQESDVEENRKSCNGCQCREDRECKGDLIPTAIRSIEEIGQPVSVRTRGCRRAHQSFRR